MKRPAGLTTFLVSLRASPRFWFLVSLLLSVGLMGYLLSQVEFERLVRMFTQIYLPSLSLYALLSLLGAGLRAYRYRLLIGPERIGIGGILLVTLIRNLLVDLLPAKLGSFSYIYLVVRRFGLPLEIGASTFVLAGVFDALSLSPLLILAIFMVGLGQTQLSTSQFTLVALAFLLLLVLLLFGLPSLLRLALRIAHASAHTLGIHERWGLPYLLRKASLSIEAIEAIQHRGAYGPVFLLSLLLRLLKYTYLYFLLHALLVNQGFPLAALNFWKVVLGIAGAEFSANLPIQGIAGIGTWETAFALAFSLMGYAKEIAITAGIGLHTITQLYEYTLGVLAILLLYSPAFRMRRPPIR